MDKCGSIMDNEYWMHECGTKCWNRMCNIYLRLEFFCKQVILKFSRPLVTLFCIYRIWGYFFLYEIRDVMGKQKNYMRNQTLKWVLFQKEFWQNIPFEYLKIQWIQAKHEIWHTQSIARSWINSAQCQKCLSNNMNRNYNSLQFNLNFAEKQPLAAIRLNSCWKWRFVVSYVDIEEVT